jgi:hypothetical protein
MDVKELECATFNAYQLLIIYDTYERSTRKNPNFLQNVT